MGTAPPMSRGSVRQGGKEELRASILKTYLLRIRSEKGERAARLLLTNAGIDYGEEELDFSQADETEGSDAYGGARSGRADIMRHKPRTVTDMHYGRASMKQMRSALEKIEAAYLKAK